MSSMPKYAAKVDRNQKVIVNALKQAGCDVFYLKNPVDLLVGFRERNFLLEIKVPKSKGERGGRRTPGQVAFFNSWRGQKAQVETVDDAYRAIGLVREVRNGR